MDTLLEKVMDKVNKDNRLLPSHVGIIIGIFRTGITQEKGDFIQVSRKKIMSFSKIKATSTYHRCLNQLMRFGYVTYHPSYDPKGATLIQFQ